jgi:hypothetical protein
MKREIQRFEQNSPEGETCSSLAEHQELPPVGSYASAATVDAIDEQRLGGLDDRTAWRKTFATLERHEAVTQPGDRRHRVCRT